MKRTRLRALVCAFALLGGSAATAQTTEMARLVGSQSGIQGDFAEGFWNQPFDPESFRTVKLSAALAMVIPNVRAYRIDAHPSLLSKDVFLAPAATRRHALDEMGKESGLSLSKTGRVIAVLEAAPRTKAPASTASMPTVGALSDARTVDLTKHAAEMPSAAMAQSARSYSANMTDENIRTTLVRWSRMAGWTFSPEHWNSNVDITLSAEADFGPDFKTATRSLLATTELASTPLQPCFYSNHVLRVIPMVERCDRTRTN